MKRKIFFVIVNYRNNKDTMLCIESISTQMSCCIIVVDNSENMEYSKELCEWIDEKYSEKANYEPQNISNNRFNILVLQENRGYANACNYAVKYVKEQADKEDLLFILNNDIMFVGNAIDVLVKKYYELGADVIGPLVLYKDNPLIINSFGAMRKYGRGAVLQYFHKPLKMSNLPVNYQVNSLHGCCFLLKIKIFDVIGYFDENYFLYLEETDWFFRGERRNLKYFVVREAIVLHAEGITTRSLNSYKKVIILSNLFYFVVKNYRGVEKVLGLMIFLFKLLVNYKIMFRVLTRCKEMKRYHGNIYNL